MSLVQNDFGTRRHWWSYALEVLRRLQSDGQPSCRLTERSLPGPAVWLNGAQGCPDVGHLAWIQGTMAADSRREPTARGLMTIYSDPHRETCQTASHRCFQPGRPWQGARASVWLWQKVHLSARVKSRVHIGKTMVPILTEASIGQT